MLLARAPTVLVLLSCVDSTTWGATTPLTRAACTGQPLHEYSLSTDPAASKHAWEPTRQAGLCHRPVKSTKESVNKQQHHAPHAAHTRCASHPTTHLLEGRSVIKLPTFCWPPGREYWLARLPPRTSLDEAPYACACGTVTVVWVAAQYAGVGVLHPSTDKAIPHPTTVVQMVFMLAERHLIAVIMI